MSHAHALPVAPGRVPGLALAPLLMPDQKLNAPFTDPAAAVQGPQDIRDISRRIAVLGLPATMMVGLGVILATDFIADGHLAGVEVLLVCVLLVPLYWEAVSAALCVAGAFWTARAPSPVARELTVALLLTLRDEPAEPAIERAVRLLCQLESRAQHRFSLHVLSDSKDAVNELRERATVQVLKRRHGGLDINYRHRAANTDYKSGNIRDWIRQSGHAHDAMLVLDADSRMGCESVLVLTDMLAADDGLGLVQSVPSVLSGRSVWQRMQSFASRAHGQSLGRGLALVSGGDGNFYGHNAIVRIRAFAASAGLPHIDAPPPFGGVIMSHDFVEAALLRRAGWRVAFAPEAEDSFEDTPETLSGFIRRDSRWCHGNMQHLLLLQARGLRLFSRFHLVQGAMNYLNAPLWLAAVLLWSFTPPQISWATAWVLTACVASVLLVPRAIGLARVLSQSAGQRMMVLREAMTELVLSSLIAPTLMVHRILMLMRLFVGAPATWPPHQMEAQPHLMLLWLHLPAVLTGTVLSASVLAGYTSLWALPFAISLMFAPLLAMFVEMPARRQSSVTV